MLVKRHIVLAAAIGVLLTGCDRIGSEAWCEKQSQRPKEDWTFEEAADYTKYCVLHMDPEKWCEKLEKKPKGDWTANEAAEYARNCLTGRSDKE
jgi:hypothetical protein